MPNKPPPLLFDFKAHIDISNPPASAFPPANSHTARAAGASQPKTGDSSQLISDSKVVTEKVIIDALNQDASQIAEELRLEIRKNLSQDQNQYTVQATISFSEGSIVAIGTVLLTAWTVLKPIVGNAAMQAVEAELASIIQYAIKKVLSSFLAKTNVSVTDPILVNVIPTPNANSSITQQSTFLQGIPRPLMLLTVGNMLLFVILIIILVITLAPHIQIK